MREDLSDVGVVVFFIVGWAMIVGYIALGIFCARMVWTVSVEIRQQWLRILVTTFVLAILLAPGLVRVASEGGGIAPGPAWLMFIQGANHSEIRHFARYALFSFLTTWAACFVAVMLYTQGKSRRNKQESK